jgi:flagellar basal body rod protein FlgG
MSSCSSRSPNRSRQTLNMMLLSSLAALQMACTVLVNTANTNFGNWENPDFKQHPFKATESALDWAIDGQGYFYVLDISTGTYYYTRKGQFKLNKDNQISTPEGYVLDPLIALPKETEQYFISEGGNIWAKGAYSKNEWTTLGQISLNRFPKPEALKELRPGSGYFLETLESGKAVMGQPKQNFYGFIVNHALENTASAVSAIPAPGCQNASLDKQAKTDQPLDWAIEGPGLFTFLDPLNGYRYFSRRAKMYTHPNGQWSNEYGYRLDPAVALPAGHQFVRIDPDGSIWSGKDPSKPEKTGQVVLAMPEKPDSLKALGFSRGSVYLAPNPEADKAIKSVSPGQAGSGKIKSGYLENCAQDLGLLPRDESKRQMIVDTIL